MIKRSLHTRYDAAWDTLRRVLTAEVSSTPRMSSHSATYLKQTDRGSWVNLGISEVRGESTEQRADEGAERGVTEP